MLRSAILAAVMVVGCSRMAYSSPAQPTNEKGVSTTLELPYDKVWHNLIDTLSTSFLSIERVDKTSGIIRLRLRTAHPEIYIDCGHVVYESHEFPFNGPYAQFRRDVALVGRMNIRVRAVNEQRTSIRVHTRYVFGKWEFETRRRHTRQIQTNRASEARTCAPTHAAEGWVLESVQENR